MSAVQTTKRQDFWDCVKGFAILSVVLGHGFRIPHDFVYAYHLALFYFVSGWFYREEKYGDYPELNVAARVKSCWPKFVVYSFFLIVLHFLLQDFLEGMLNERYSLRIAICACFDVTLFRIKDLTGAMWFVPQIVFSSTLFGIIVWLARRSWCRKKKHVVIITLGFLFGAIGCVFSYFGIELAGTYYLQFVMKAMPIYLLAYYCRLAVQDRFRNYLRLPAAIFCACLIIACCYFKTGMGVNAGPLSFYGLGAAGIYLILYLCKYVEKVGILRTVFAALGRYSFEIMAWHFLIYYLFNAVINQIGHLPQDVFSLNNYQQLWFLQLPVLLGLPCVIGFGYRKLREVLIQ